MTSELDTCLRDPLAKVRSATDPIGFVGMDVPDDVLAGSGRVYCHLPWDADQATPLASHWLEASFSPMSKSILQSWAEGRFDMFETVVFSRGEDNAQRLYYYICELQRRGEIGGPRPVIFDVGYIRRPSSLSHTVKAVRDLAAAVGADEQALTAGIVKANRRRAEMAEETAKRGTNGVAYERLSRARLFGFDAVADRSETPVRGRVLLAGTAPPDDRLHSVVEASGWAVVAEAYDRGLGRTGPPVSETGDPARAIAAQVHAMTLPSRSFVDRADWLVSEARRQPIDAVILWLIEEEEALVWSSPMQAAALKAAGIPHLVMTRRRWDAKDGAAEEITAFLKGLRA